MLDTFSIRKYSVWVQCSISIALIGLTSIFSFFSIELIGYRGVALILLLMVSILAMLLDIFPVLLAAVLSALIWNYFFIPPTFTFHLGSPEDLLMFLMYFVVALINTVLTFKIREFEKNKRDKEEREKTIELYNTLLNSLSHELRTPISAIIGAVDTIRENEERLSVENRKELLSEIGIASFRLNRQVENLLNISRLEANILKPKLDWCDINELIVSVLNDNEEAASEHVIIYQVNDDLSLFKLDRDFIEQVLQNILHNALQHTPPQTVIKIVTSQHESILQITIEDNGKGFPENEIDSVFDKFYQIPNTSGGGTGLGLSIVKGFIEAHNGKIYLENIKDGGAKFTMQIPAEILSINELRDEQE